MRPAEEKFNPVLREAARVLGSQRPPVPSSLRYTLDYEETLGGLLARFWFRTRGCTHSIRGGCTMCDYWVSTEVDAHETRESVRAVLAQLQNRRVIDLLIENSGSFFDDREVKPELRPWILRQFRSLSLRYLIVETRNDMLGEESLEACVAALRPSRLVVEFGVESLDPWVLKHCVNKGTNKGAVERAVQLVRDSHALATANVLLGSPFLSLSEQIRDSSRTLRGVLAMGYDSAVLFPVNVKHYTLTGWLRDRGLYRAPSLWALLDVLSDVETGLLSKVLISWHRPRSDYHPGYTTSYSGPETCSDCYGRVAALLDQWRASTDRAKLLGRLNRVNCACREEHEAQKRSAGRPLIDRVRAQQMLIAQEILQGKWAPEYINTIPEHRLSGG